MMFRFVGEEFVGTTNHSHTGTRLVQVVTSILASLQNLLTQKKPRNEPQRIQPTVYSIMSTTTTSSSSTSIPPAAVVEAVIDSTTDQWRATSQQHSEKWTQFKLTSLYADDLVTLIYDDIRRATTILDIGCGVGVFAQAYLRAFPEGIVGQTVISSDISPSMLEQAQSSYVMTTATTTTTNCATRFVFQLEDGSQLQGIEDHSIDIVVSLYGVFLIPDQVSTLQSIRRVLVPNTGILANAAWTKHENIDPSFGGNLQDTFMGLGRMVQQMKSPSSSSVCDPTTSVPAVAAPPAFVQWFDPMMIETNLTQQHQYVNVRTYRLFHTMISRNFHALLEMCLENPMIHATNLSDEQMHTLKYAFFDLCKIPYRSKAEQDQMIMNHYHHHHDTDPKETNSINVPFTLWTASNITICHV